MVKITTEYKGNMLFETKIGEHTLKIDVPESMGGQDRGPQPPQLFVASLGSCIAALVAKYCEENGIDNRDMTVDITFEKADDPTRLTDVKVTIMLPHGDCSKRVRAIERVAELCPVHSTIRTMQDLDVEILGEEECNLAPESSQPKGMTTP